MLTNYEFSLGHRDRDTAQDIRVFFRSRMLLRSRAKNPIGITASTLFRLDVDLRREVAVNVQNEVGAFGHECGDAAVQPGGDDGGV